MKQKNHMVGPGQVRGRLGPRGWGVPALSAAAPTGPVGGPTTPPQCRRHGNVLRVLTVSFVLALSGISGQATLWTALTKTALVAGGATVAVLMGPTGAGVSDAMAGPPGPQGPQGPSASTDESDEGDAIAIAIGSLGLFTDKATTLSFGAGTFDGESAAGLGVSHTFKGDELDVRIDLRGACGVGHGQCGAGGAVTFGW